MLEGLYSLKVATELIPYQSVEALRMFLRKHKDLFPAKYRAGRPGERVLTETEILKIREMYITDKGRWTKSFLIGRPRGKRSYEGSTLSLKEIFNDNGRAVASTARPLNKLTANDYDKWYGVRRSATE